MADYIKEEPRVTVVKRRGAGFTITLLLIVAALVVALLFATGFWSADVTKSGALPTVQVNGGEMPKVDLQSKEIVVGTTATKVEVPTVKTETTTIDVPTVGVKDDKK
jgi:hypothetical protein